MNIMSDDALLARVMKKAAVSPKPNEQSAPVHAPQTPKRAERAASRPLSRLVAGFHGRARVMTSFGELPVEALRRRDELRTAEGAYLRVAAVDKIHFDADFVERHSTIAPLRIRAGALGRDLPKQDVILSPGQLISTSSAPSTRQCKTVAELTHLPGVLPVPRDMITYYSFHCDKPALVQVEGLWVQTAP